MLITEAKRFLMSEDRAYGAAIGELSAVGNLLKALATAELTGGEAVEGNTLQFLSERVTAAIEAITEG